MLTHEGNTFEQAARERKCHTIALHLKQSVLDALAKLTDEEWLALAAQAHVKADKPPSAESRAMVRKIVEGWK